MKNFCFNAFTGLDISPTGNIAPCCKFLKEELPNFHISDGIEQYKKSEFLKKLQSQFSKNERPNGCHRCWVEEDAGIRSKRQLDYIRHQKHFDSLTLNEPGFSNISFAFGNLCNFACRICGPNSSSRWVTELKKMNINKGAIQNWYQKREHLDDVFNHIRDAVHIDIPGGEPLLLELKEHFAFLDRFSLEQKKKMSLHYVTNGSNYPKQSHLDIWKDFQKIDLQLSLDDIEHRFEYNRWPGKWHEVLTNVKKYKKLCNDSDNISLSISFTLSAFTVFYAEDFCKWCIKNGLPLPWIGRLDFPDYYRIGVLPKDKRQLLIDRYEKSKISQIRSIADLLKSDKDQQYFTEFKRKIFELDDQRQQSFEKTFPELADILK
jgi:radical SAM protein with 4Fe4S-binding SPASM domain